MTNTRYEVREHEAGGWIVFDTETGTIEQEFDFRFSAQNLADILNSNSGETT